MEFAAGVAGKGFDQCIWQGTLHTLRERSGTWAVHTPAVGLAAAQYAGPSAVAEALVVARVGMQGSQQRGAPAAVQNVPQACPPLCLYPACAVAYAVAAAAAAVKAAVGRRAVWQASLAGSPPAPPPLPWALALGKWAARKGRLSWGLKLAAACAGCRRLVGGWVWKPVAECDEAPLAACCGKFLGCTAAWDKLLGLGIEMCDAGKPCPGRDWPSG
eukprot:scaffold17043_cov18-Tisochrysis_lutea.AAC.4